jgi:hypothetical protein
VELEQVLESLLDYAAQWPAHARVLLIEVQSAGPAGVERHEATMGMLAGRLSQCDQWRPGRCRDLGREEMGQAVVGAIARMVQARLISTGNGTVAGLLPSVVALTTRVAVEA